MPTCNHHPVCIRISPPRIPMSPSYHTLRRVLPTKDSILLRLYPICATISNSIATRCRFKTASRGGRGRPTYTRLPCTQRLPPNARLFHPSRLFSLHDPYASPPSPARSWERHDKAGEGMEEPKGPGPDLKRKPPLPALAGPYGSPSSRPQGC